MKCKKCGSEWHCAGNVRECPFCRRDCTLPPEEIEALFAAAAAMPETAEASARTEAYRLAAEYGHREAEYRLGLAYENGTGTARSQSRAAVYYLCAAQQGHAEAACRLSLNLRERYRGTAEADKAYFWLRVAAELGSVEGCFLLGECYETGEGIQANPLRAAYWYTIAAEGGNFRAAYRLALLYHEGKGVRQNTAYEKYYAEIASNGGIRAADRLLARIDSHTFSEVPARIEIRNRNEDRFELGFRAYGEGKYTVAAKMYELAANDGYARAQNSLGVCYENGHGVEKDLTTAAFWYERAAKGGFDMAYLNLGDCYCYGRGKQKNEETAFTCYKIAAERGFAQAQYLVANCYFDAVLTERSIPDAMKWYEKAAIQGYGDAIEKVNELRTDVTELYNRGVDAYEKGDYPTAVKFYAIASEFGHRGAQCNLGFCYQHGQGCEKNDRMAVHYYQKAVAQESGVAEFNLASCYLRGEGGLPYNYKKARALLEKAERHGAEKAGAVLAELNTRRKKKLARRVYATSAAILHRGEEYINDALKFRLIAAEMGNPRAMFAMGCHYEFGFGLDTNERAAESWYRRAQVAGYRSGSKMKSTLLRMMRRPQSFRDLPGAYRPEKTEEGAEPAEEQGE